MNVSTWLRYLVILTVASLCSIAYKEHKRWEQFKVDHSCKVAAVTVDSQPNKTGWHCDDGKTYYRPE